MNVVYGFLMVTVVFGALWWAFARGHFPRALGVLSLVSLGLAAVALVLDGLHWQLVPWQALAGAMAAAASVRWCRPGHSRRWNRGLGRIGLLAGVTLGGVGLLFVSVPLLPRPAGQHLVGSEVLRWTDLRRGEAFTEDPQDRREVVAQAWYPTEVGQGQRVPYFEAQDHLPALIDIYPSWFFNDFRQADTHATISPALSEERATGPALLFSPGWGSSREDYTGLCADLASRGYVVVALSHPFESAVSVLASGQVVGQGGKASLFGANAADMSDIRAADSSVGGSPVVDSSAESRGAGDADLVSPGRGVGPARAAVGLRFQTVRQGPRRSMGQAGHHALTRTAVILTCLASRVRPSVDATDGLVGEPKQVVHFWRAVAHRRCSG